MKMHFLNNKYSYLFRDSLHIFCYTPYNFEKPKYDIERQSFILFMIITYCRDVRENHGDRPILFFITTTHITKPHPCHTDKINNSKYILFLPQSIKRRRTSITFV